MIVVPYVRNDFICEEKISIFDDFRPHHSTTYEDATYCYRSVSGVCRSVCHKRAKPIKMPFTMLSRLVPRNHVLDERTNAPTGRGTF